MYTYFSLKYTESRVEALGIRRVVGQNVLDVSKGPSYLIFRVKQSKKDCLTLNTQAQR